jgi:hypothetical protein
MFLRKKRVVPERVPEKKIWWALETDYQHPVRVPRKL